MKKIESLLLLACLLLACNGKKPVPPGVKPDAMSVTGQVVKTGLISEPLQLPGSLLPMEEAELHPEVSGRVVGLYIQEGGFVKKGALLVKLFDDDLQAQLRKLEVQLEISEKTEERNKELLQLKGLSQQDYDLSFLQVSNIKADIALLKTNIARTEIRAPFDGKLGFRNISIGAYVTPLTVITTIRQVNQLKLQFSVPEKYTSTIRPGRLITFRTDSSPQKFTAKVYAAESTVNQDSRGMNVRCIVQSMGPALIAGAFAKVDMDFAKNPQAILVPTQAVLPQARTKKLIVYRKGFAKFVEVETGIRDSANVEITHGVKPGDTIVITGLLAVRPGAKITLSKVQ